MYEYLFLKDLNLKLYTVCHIFIPKCEELCPLKDDRDMIIKKRELEFIRKMKRKISFNPSLGFIVWFCAFK
jgi:hypothetical protein